MSCWRASPATTFKASITAALRVSVLPLCTASKHLNNLSGYANQTDVLEQHGALG